MEHGEEALVYLVIQKAVDQVDMDALEDADEVKVITNLTGSSTPSTRKKPRSQEEPRIKT